MTPKRKIAGKPINLRVSQETREVLEKLAQDDGRTLSGYLHRVIALHLASLQRSTHLDPASLPVGPEEPTRKPAKIKKRKRA